jgi:hypothetical protein
MLDLALEIQSRFDNRITAVGSLVDSIYFCSEYSSSSDLDFAFAAEDTQFMRDKIIELNLDVKEYTGVFCGRKFAGRVNGAWVDFFMTYPFTSNQVFVYNELRCQTKEDRWSMIMLLSLISPTSKWAKKCNDKFAKLINAGAFRL